jgi:hypothetical protein
MMVSGVLALVWVTYPVVRQQRISSALFRDQVGMALLLMSVLIFISNFSGPFDE